MVQLIKSLPRVKTKLADSWCRFERSRLAGTLPLPLRASWSRIVKPIAHKHEITVVVGFVACKPHWRSESVEKLPEACSKPPDV